jgi:uncharacterized LabA/DUF88 family protein
MQNQRKEVVCFVDGPNLFWGNRQSGIKLDYRKLESLLAGNGQVHKTYFFNSTPEESSDAQLAFDTYLRKQLGWSLMKYDLGRKSARCPSCDSMRLVHCEKGVDIGIAMKMLQVAASGICKKIILVSGDADFCEVVQVIQTTFSIPVQIVAWKSGLSPRMAECSSLPVTILDSFKRRLELRAA